MRIIRYGLLVSTLFYLTACVNGVWTGANMVYDRHGVYKQMSDVQLSANFNHALYYKDQTFKCDGCAIDIAVLNRDVLVAGHLPTKALRDALQARLATLNGYRRLFNQIKVARDGNNTIQDSWITTQIRSEMVADIDINPKQFKVVTVDGIVYLMGDVMSDQALRVIQIARQTSGVIRVVTLMKYYNLSASAG